MRLRRGSGLLSFRHAVLLAAAIVSIGILLAAAVLLAGRLGHLPGPLLPKAGQGNVARFGQSSPIYALYAFVAPLILALSYVATGALIAWRQPDERGPLVFSLLLIFFGDAFALGALAPEPAHASVLVRFLVSAGFISLVASSYVFPDGVPTPRWTWGAMAVWLYIAVGTSWLAGSRFDPNTWTGVGASIFWLGIVATCLIAQVYRYRHVSGPIQRQQTKWVALGLSAVVVAVTLFTSPLPIPASLLAWRQFLLGLLLMTSLLLIPLTIGTAMLRYRLWEIDVLINRTLVYGSLTVSLGALYVGAVILLQALFRVVTGQHSDLAIAVATLAVAALFNPWRRRLQAFIDRRFYRRRYDAARTLAAFTIQLHDEVDLEKLTSDMLSVIHDTMQPNGASVWLPDTASEGH
ncbi:MAG TPA: hypothetical protein VFB58_00740 [Chloroflexota bacterium]|nr:hypothetical protein [Chloroflexota bacterium]